MALKNDFYNEIFINEQKWIEYINKNLLNSVYFNLTLKPFYTEKKQELENEYSLTNNEIIGNIINIIDGIINKIEVFVEQYKNGESVDTDSLIPLFLTTQMNNNSKNVKKDEIDELKTQKLILENQIKNYNKTISNSEDYLYDDFPEEQIKKRI